MKDINDIGIQIPQVYLPKPGIDPQLECGRPEGQCRQRECQQHQTAVVEHRPLDGTYDSAPSHRRCLAELTSD